jgi:hypothetical protein
MSYGGYVARVDKWVDKQLNASVDSRTTQLFLALAEELKLPFMYIARQAELQSMIGSALGESPANPLRDIRETADMSLRLLDSYLLSLRLSLQPDTLLALEPVSVSAVLYDTAHQLQYVASQYGVTLELPTQPKYEPVMAHRQALQSALVSLGYTLIEALPAAGVKNMCLHLATHRTKYGIVAGMYGELDTLTPRMFRRALDLQGVAPQPLVATSPGSAAGIFVADAILNAMSSRLRVGRYHKQPGFAVTLNASEQLQLV